METIVYFFSNAEVLRKNISYDDVKEPQQLKAEKLCLSVSGEKTAREIANNNEFNKISKIYASSYVRAIATAKYLAEKNECPIIIESRFGERKIGILGNMENRLFHQNQIKDFNFKLNGGESLNQVRERMSEALNKLLADNSETTIAIFSHQVAIMSLLTTWCDKEFSLDDRLVLSYNEEVVIDESWENPEVFKLVFNNKELKTITRLS